MEYHALAGMAVVLVSDAEGIRSKQAINGMKFEVK